MSSISTEMYSFQFQTTFLLLLSSSLVTLILTAIPALFDLPIIQDFPTYTVSDIIRFIEPLITLPLTVFILLQSPLFTNQYDPVSKESHSYKLKFNITIFLFMFFSALYQQGAGFHSASTLFKQSLENPPLPLLISTDPSIQTLYLWLRNTWEHLISHYIYLAGSIGVSFIFAYVFNSVSIPDPLNKKQIFLFILSVAIYGLLIGAVAIQFIQGTIVGLVLCIGYGWGVIGTLIWRRKGFSGFYIGVFPVLQYYFYSYTLGFIIIIGWICKYGIKSRDEMY